MLWPLVPDEKYIRMIYRKRQEAFLEEADRERMTEKEIPVNQSRLERILFSVGEILVSVGERLRERSAPLRSQEYKASQTKIKMNGPASYGWMEENSILGIPKGSEWPTPSANATLISVEHGEC